MLEVRLLPRRPAELAVVPQMLQLGRVFLKVALERLAAQEFLSEFSCAGFADGDFGDRAEGWRYVRKYPSRCVK